MAAKKMILISQEKYDRLMRQDPPPIENAEKALVPKPVGRKAPSFIGPKRKEPSVIGPKRKAPSSVASKRKAQPPPPGEPASKSAKRVLKFKRY